MEEGPNTKPLALCRAQHRVRLLKGSLGETKVCGVMRFIGKRRKCHNHCQLRTSHFVCRMSRGRFFAFAQVSGTIPFAPLLRKPPRARPPFSREFARPLPGTSGLREAVHDTVLCREVYITALILCSLICQVARARDVRPQGD